MKIQQRLKEEASPDGVPTPPTTARKRLIDTHTCFAELWDNIKEKNASTPQPDVQKRRKPNELSSAGANSSATITETPTLPKSTAEDQLPSTSAQANAVAPSKALSPQAIAMARKRSSRLKAKRQKRELSKHMTDTEFQEKMSMLREEHERKMEILRMKLEIRREELRQLRQKRIQEERENGEASNISGDDINDNSGQE